MIANSNVNIHVLKLLRSIRRDFIAFIANLIKKHGDFLQISVKGFYLAGRFKKYIVTTNPHYLKHILQDNYKNYTKLKINGILNDLIGNGLFMLTDLEKWRKRRSIVTPTFHFKQIECYLKPMLENTLSTVSEWKEKLAKNEPIDVSAEMHYLTGRIATKALFSLELESDIKVLHDVVTTVMDHNFYETVAAIKIPRAFPIKRNRKLKIAIRQLHEIINRIIDSHIKNETNFNDLLTLLLTIKDPETDEPLSEHELKHEIVNLLIAGYETTAASLGWTWALLSRHPDICARVYQEVDSILQGKPIKYEQIDQLNYLKSVVQESLRLYPPVWAYLRKAIDDDVVGENNISKGTLIFIPTYFIHRDKNYWKNPEGFDPERFSQENRDNSRPKYAYQPFGGGPRICIGSGFAMAEAVVVLATLIQHFHIHLAPGMQLDIEKPYAMVMRIDKNLKMEVYQR